MASSSGVQSVMAAVVRLQAKSYLAIKRPTLIVVAGSVGKTSTKLYLSRLLAAHTSVRCMDDSYNNGIGLYLSVFNKKIPTRLRSPAAWLGLLGSNFKDFFHKAPNYLILEYGIDGVGDMDEMIRFARPDIAILTAVTPEHMEFLKDIDTVGAEETGILRAVKKFGMVNADSVDKKYFEDITPAPLEFGSADSLAASYEIDSYTKSQSVISIKIAHKTIVSKTKVNLISDALVGQLSGAVFLAHKLGVPAQKIQETISTIQPAASRMRVLDGANDSVIIDDTANFSPEAGIVALQSLKKLDAKRRIAVLGNMHELGEYGKKGFKDVSEEFDGIDLLVLVGDISKEEFLPLAKEKGFELDKTVTCFDTAIEAGEHLRPLLKSGDAVVVKGPFGGFYLEETVKLLLKDPSDRKLLTRQSDFWLEKKSKLFGRTIS